MPTYRINTQKIVYEILNTEVIAIDFHTGNYYAIVHIAKQVWQLIESQVPLQRIAQLLAKQYSSDPDEVLLDMKLFIEQLVEEGLVELVADTECSAEAPDVMEIAPSGWEYSAPTLQKYEDVRNLLLLDPIHEVTDAGWPQKADIPSN
jgi:tyrosine-protein phosphatase YwqE